jgi:hypothetical protein
VVGHFKAQNITHHALDLLDARVAELQYFSTILTNQVVVLLKGIGFLELCQVLPELMLGNQVAGK